MCPRITADKGFQFSAAVTAATQAERYGPRSRISYPTQRPASPSIRQRDVSCRVVSIWPLLVPAGPFLSGRARGAGRTRPTKYVAINPDSGDVETESLSSSSSS
jgi:hypothetical protein